MYRQTDKERDDNVQTQRERYEIMFRQTKRERQRDDNVQTDTERDIKYRQTKRDKER